MRAQLGQLYDLANSLRPANFCIGETFVLMEPLVPAHAQVAVRHLISKYEILRALFSGSGLDIELEILESNDPGFDKAFEVRCSSCDENTRRAILLEYISNVRESMSLSRLPLFHYCLFESKRVSEQRLVFIINHLICDGISSRILWRDFSLAYRRSLNGQTIPVIPSSVYSQFSEELLKRNLSISQNRDLVRSLEIKDGSIDILDGTQMAALPVSKMADAIIEIRCFHGNTLRRIRRAAFSHGVGLSEFFLALFIRALGAELGAGTISMAIWFSPHFVGEWKTSVHDLVGSVSFPVPSVFTIKPGVDLNETLRTVKTELYSTMAIAADYAAVCYSQVSIRERPKLPAITFNFVGDQRRSSNLIACDLAPENIRIGRTADEIKEVPLTIDIEMYDGMLELNLSARPDGGLARFPSLLTTYIERDLTKQMAAI